jgi:GNAT superfamily N-acetyltransferase
MSIVVRAIPPEQTRPLRQQLLRQGVPLDKLIYPGDLDADALHVGAFDGARQVGIATVMRQPPIASNGTPPDHPAPEHAAAWRLRGMASTDDMRGQGVGTAMLRAVFGHVAAQGGAFLWCDARIIAVPFYLKNGLVTLGEQYYVPDVGPHYFMQRDAHPDDIQWTLPRA